MQGAAAEVTGVVVPVGVVVVVNVHDQITDTSVAPVTIAVNVTDWFTTSVPPCGATETTTTFPLLPPPHPAIVMDARAAAHKRTLLIFAFLIPTVSPKSSGVFFR